MWKQSFVLAGVDIGSRPLNGFELWPLARDAVALDEVPEAAEVKREIYWRRKRELTVASRPKGNSALRGSVDKYCEAGYQLMSSTRLLRDFADSLRALVVVVGRGQMTLTVR